jgi:hypothetical protein
VVADYRQEPPAWNDASNWRVSDFLIGSPGVDESGGAVVGGWQVPGDINQDAGLDLSDAVGLLLHLFGGKLPVLGCGDGTLADEGNQALLDSSGDGRVDLSDAVHVLNYLFLGGNPPSLGRRCTRIPGCPDVCN